MRATSDGKKHHEDIRRERIYIGNLCKRFQHKQILLLLVVVPFRMNLGNTENMSVIMIIIYCKC